MTDVLIDKKIAGHVKGSVVPLTPQLQKHVEAGNAIILPNSHEAWQGQENPEPTTPDVLTMQGTGHASDERTAEAGHEGPLPEADAQAYADDAIEIPEGFELDEIATARLIDAEDDQPKKSGLFGRS